MTLLKLKNGQLINLDALTRITPRNDTVEMDLGTLSVTLKDADDVKAFWAIAEPRNE
jgi:hypothetical protein